MDIIYKNILKQQIQHTVVGLQFDPETGKLCYLVNYTLTKTLRIDPSKVSYPKNQKIQSINDAKELFPEYLL